MNEEKTKEIMRKALSEAISKNGAISAYDAVDTLCKAYISARQPPVIIRKN